MNDKKNALADQYPQYEIGRWSYGKPQILRWNEQTTLKMGAFCSIAQGVKIFLGGEHRTDWLTTYPFNVLWEEGSGIIGHPKSKGDVIIGNDVWIGAHAMIMSGVTIGDGAVIGAGAVVTKNVEAYAIYAGNPARLIKKRFSDSIIAQLLAIQWWHFPDERIAELLPLLCNDNITGFIEVVTGNTPQDEQPISAILPARNDIGLDQIFCYSTQTSWAIKEPDKNYGRFLELIGELTELVMPGYYFSDNLFTWCRNNSALDDKAFQKAWHDNIKNNSDAAILWRRYILVTSAYHCVQLDGDFVECGVYWGTGIKTVMDYLGGTAFPKTFWGFDTYDYHPEEGHHFSDQQEGFFQRVQERFVDYPQAKLIQGLLPDIFSEHCPQKIAYLHIDLNSAKYEVAVLDKLFDLVVSGGMIVLDDYEWSGVYRPQKMLEDKWFDPLQYRVIPLPTGQGLLIKR